MKIAILQFNPQFKDVRIPVRVAVFLGNSGNVLGCDFVTENVTVQFVICLLNYLAE